MISYISLSEEHFVERSIISVAPYIHRIVGSYVWLCLKVMLRTVDLSVRKCFLSLEKIFKKSYRVMFGVLFGRKRDGF